MCFGAEWGPRQARPQFRCGHWGQAIWKQGPEYQKIPTCKGRQRVKGHKDGAIPPCGRGAAAKWTWRRSQKKRQEVRGSQRRPVLPKRQLPLRKHKGGRARQVGRGYLPLGNTRQTAAHSKPRRQNHKKGGHKLLRPLPARICTIKRSPTKTSAQKTERTRQARRAIGGQAQPARETLANRTPAGCRSADPQKVGGAPRPSRGRLRPSGQCEHVLHAREKKQAYGLVPAEDKKQVGTKRTLSWQRKPLASRIAAGCHRKESPHKVSSAAEALWARLRTAVASAALFGKEERRRTPTTFLREKSPQTAEGPRRCRRC